MEGIYKDCVVVATCGLILPMEVPEQIAEYFDMTDEIVESFPDRGLYRCDLHVERESSDPLSGEHPEYSLWVSNIRPINYNEVQSKRCPGCGAWVVFEEKP